MLKNLNNIVFVCGLLFLVTLAGWIFYQNTNKKKVNKQHDCFRKCKPVFEHMEIFDRQLKENGKSFCDEHRSFYENFSNFPLSHNQ